MSVAIPLVAGGIGAWAGTAIGIGAAAGWAIGSAAGSLLEQKMFGPELPPNAITDLSVQTSAWGTGLPDIFGVQRVAGNIIWSTDKRLVGGNQGKFGGKGGGGGKGGKGGKKGTGSQGYYEVSIALALCEGPIAGIKRIWAGGDLIYDDSAPVYVPSMDPNNPQGGYQQFNAQNNPITSTGGSSLGSWTLYHGTMDQGADGTIVANGSGNGANGVPYQQVTLANGFEYTYGAPAFGKLGTACAYKGIAYIVFPNLNIGYGGSMPPLTFEVVGRQTSIVFDTPAAISGLFNPMPTSLFRTSNTNLGGGCALIDPDTIAIPNDEALAYADVSTGRLVSAIHSILSTDNSYYPNLYPRSMQVVNNAVYCVTTNFVGQINEPRSATAYATFVGAGVSVGAPGTLVSNGSALFLVAHAYASAVPVIVDFQNKIDVQGDGNELTSPYGPTINGWPYWCQIGNYLYLGTSSNQAIQCFDMGAKTFTNMPVVQVVSPTSIQTIFTDGTYLYICDSNWVVYKYTVSAASMTLVGQYQAPIHSGGFFFANGWCYARDNTLLYKLNPDFSIRYTITPPYAWDYALASKYGLVMVQRNYGSYSNNPEYYLMSYGDTKVIPQPYPLSLVIQSICQRAGFTSYDVSLVPSSIAVNLTRHAGTPARDVLKVLCQIYAMDMVDSAGTLKFVPKGQAIAAQLQVSDIGYTKSSTATPPAPYILTRAAEVDLPRSLTLKYTSALANYNSYAQMFQISAAASYGKDVTVSVPLTLDDTTALNAAMLLCTAPHIEKNAYAWTTSLNWLQLEPGDVVQMPWGVTRITQVTLRDAQQQPMIEFQGVIDATYVLNSGYGQAQAVAPPALATSASAQAALAAASGGNFVANNAGASSNNNAVQSRPALNPGYAYAKYLEPPPLSSSDTTPRYLVAPYTTGNQFIGVAVYESTDGGTTYTEISQQGQSAVVGYAANALPSTQPWTWDTTSTLNVYLSSTYMQLSSATDLQVIQGANLAMLGNELIQFANATLTTDVAGNAYYQLSRLLRGRRGTEWAMGSHAVGDSFVLLQVNDETTVDYALSSLNNSAEFKVATVGQDISTVAQVAYAPSGIWYKPWAPANLTVSLDASNNWTVNFFARARLNGVWGSGVAPALDPDTTTWSIDVLSGSTVKRTVTGNLTSPSFMYTAAMQSADGFTPGAHGITFNVYQVGTLGRGYVSTITT